MIVTSVGTFDLIISIKVIKTDPSLTDEEKAKKRKELMGGCDKQQIEDADGKGDDDDIMELLGANFKCSFCMLLPERPITMNISRIFFFSTFIIICFLVALKEEKKHLLFPISFLFMTYFKNVVYIFKVSFRFLRSEFTFQCWFSFPIISSEKFKLQKIES